METAQQVSLFFNHCVVTACRKMRWLRRHHIIFIYSVTHAYPNVKLLDELESRTVISKVKIFSEVCRLFNDAFSVTQTVQ
jgi:hypothetical protein